MEAAIGAPSMESRSPGPRVRRALWSMVVLLVLIGAAVVVRRMVHLVPVLVNGYHPPGVPSNPTLAQFAALDDVFARYPILTLVHRQTSQANMAICGRSRPARPISSCRRS